MSGIKDFKEYMKTGVVKAQSPDKSRAEFLIREAKQSYSNLMEMIKKIGVGENNANDYVKYCYDLLMELIRAQMLLKGYNASGFGAHEAEVSYMRTIGFKENEVQFADQMRYFRNGILYYGTILGKNYAEKVIKFTKENYQRLNK